MNKSKLHILVLLALLVFSGVSASAQVKKNKVEDKTKAAVPPKMQLSKKENEVVEELNTARKNPEKYIAHLEERRAAMHGTVIKLPKQKEIRTIEGAPPIEDAIKDLKKVSDLKEFQVDEGLTRVARAQLADLQENEDLGHFGKDGSDLKVRIARFGKASGKCAENICHRGRTARDVVTIFLVDDGVPARSHRKAVLSENFKQIGVACGTGNKANELCVVVFANDFKDKIIVSDTKEF